MMSNIIRNYLFATTAFGASYKMLMLWNATVETCIDGKTALRPLLMGEKLVAFSLGTVCSPLLAPLWAMQSLDHLDMYMMGKTPKELGIGHRTRRDTLFDHVYL